MFRSTSSFGLFDYFRVPYELEGSPDAVDGRLERLAATEGGATLFWPSATAIEAGSLTPDIYRLGSVPIAGRVLAAETMRTLAAGLAGTWHEAELLHDEGGAPVSAVWRSSEGGSLLPFDPNDVVANVLTERYVQFGARRRATSAASLGRVAYYVVRPLLPRAVQITLRRAFSRVQERRRFPRWPVETALDDFYAYLFGLVADLTDRPVPFIAPWPRQHTWALVLTHDVEQAVGYENVGTLLDVEVEHGYRSSWNFVPCNGYVVEDDVLELLHGDGFEVGVHGLYHDGRDISPRTFARRRPAVREYADKWGAVGFRSPATIRSAHLIPRLGFDYDSSYSDTAPFEPQAGGCCSWLPYMLEGTVELPITLVQDHTLFDLLRHRDETMWIDKARLLRERGGMALVVTHSDYVSTPGLVESYRRLLREFAGDATAWKALPRDVSAWWRRRAASTLEEIDGEWRVVGPAADEARVSFAGGGERVQV